MIYFNNFRIFALIIIFSELKINFVITYFSFEQSYIGKGCFLIFVGLLCFDYLNKLKTLVGVLDLVIGILIIIYGFILLLYGLSNRGNDNSNPNQPQIYNQQNPPVANEKPNIN